MKQCFEYIKNKFHNEKVWAPKKRKNTIIDIKFEKHNIGNKSYYVKFYGISLDWLFCLIFIKENFAKILFTSLNPHYKLNYKLSNYYNENNIIWSKKGEFNNFEIFYIGNKLITPSHFDESILSFLKSNKQYLCIPICINVGNWGESHANILLYDRQNNEIERFEPYGSGVDYISSIYDGDHLDELCYKLFILVFQNVKYFSPKHFLPLICFQHYESNETKKKYKLTNPINGYCLVWCYFYVYYRLIYIETVSRLDLCRRIIKFIKRNNIWYIALSRNFASNIIQLRDKYLLLSYIDIEDWINDDYTDDKQKEFNGYILKKIQSLMSV